MTEPPTAFEETPIGGRRIRDLGLAIEGTQLEPYLRRLLEELDSAGLRHVRPRYYLSTEWGVPFGTVAIAIPFYLANADLTQIHLKRTGYVEGADSRELMRYLRHEAGHVVNYAYRLYDRKDWVKQFGSMTQSYLEDYTPKLFSREYVIYLPGWYAQKHPDEDWAETFAVWLEGGETRRWREDYREWPRALRKLEYCDALVREIAGSEPPVTADDLDEDVAEIESSLDEFYAGGTGAAEQAPPGLEGALRTIFENAAPDPGEPSAPARVLFENAERNLINEIYRWTGHSPERAMHLLRYMASRAEALGLTYGVHHELGAVLALAILVAALAMHYVEHRTYVPQ